MASIEPITSVLIMIGIRTPSVLTSWLDKIFSSEFNSEVSFIKFSASFFVKKESKELPTSGNESNPTNLIGAEKEASFVGKLRQFSNILVVTILFPLTTNIPDFNVPFLITQVAPIPLLGSCSVSIIIPEALTFLSPLRFCMSAIKIIISKRSLTPFPSLAEIGTKGISPPIPSR